MIADDSSMNPVIAFDFSNSQFNPMETALKQLSNNNSNSTTDFLRVTYDNSQPGNESLLIVLLTSPTGNSQNKTLNMSLATGNWFILSFSVDFIQNTAWFSVNNFQIGPTVPILFALNFCAVFFNENLFLELQAVNPTKFATLNLTQKQSSQNYPGKVDHFFYSFVFYRSFSDLLLCYSAQKPFDLRLTHEQLPLNRILTQSPLAKRLPGSNDKNTKNLFI